MCQIVSKYDGICTLLRKFRNMQRNVSESAFLVTMKGPRQREASQPATDPNLRPPAEKVENII